MEYYHQLKMNEPQLQVTTGMSLVNMLPNKISQTQKEKYWMIQLIRNI